jgi:hypothetical protein
MRPSRSLIEGRARDIGAIARSQLEPDAALDYRKPWSLCMRWHDVLFAHWPVDPAVLRPLVPDGLEIETFDGMAWVGVVPFRMSGIRLRRCPPIPGTRAFPELNVRTYVRPVGASGEDARGVWFFSLDATNRTAVRTAKAWFGLPYREARIRVRSAKPVAAAQESGGGTTTATRMTSAIDYVCVRTESGAPPARFEATYSPVGAPFRARAGSIERFLTERYGLYARHGAHLVGARIHHVPWPLQLADAEIRTNTMTEGLGFALPESPPLLHFAGRLDVLAWRPEPIALGGPG